MKKAIKVALLSSIITAAMVYVILEWRPFGQQERADPPEVGWASSQPPTPAQTAPLPVAAGDDERNNIDIYQKYSPGVVNITTKTLTYDFFRGPVPMDGGSGSGAVIDTQGHIVTNFHVVEGAQRLEVTLSDKTKHPAKVVGADPSNDLAVLKIDAGRSLLTPIPLGTSGRLQVGQKVLAIGNPYGLERTLTTGIISSLGRSIQARNGRIIDDIIQTDAAINPGNSGGPLLNSAGQIIGINTAILSSSGGNVGIGFAIPVDTVRRITDDLIKLGYVRRPYLGIRGPVELIEYPWLIDALRLDTEGGLMVVQVDRNSPADRAGIRGATDEVIIGNYRVPVGGDIILEFGGNPVNYTAQLADEIDRYKTGDRVRVTILRGNQRQELEVVLREAPRG